MSSWVLVADNSQARIYCLDKVKKTLDMVDEIDHQEGRWHRNDFVTSSPGRSVGSSGSGNVHMMGTDNSPKAHESVNFVRMIANSVNHAYKLHQFSTLQICAPPKLLGEILPSISKSIPQGNHINKDLVHEKPEQLLGRLTKLR